MRQLLCLGLLISCLSPLPAAASPAPSAAAAASLAQAADLMDKSWLRLRVKSFASFLPRMLQTPQQTGITPQMARFMADKAEIAFAPGYLEQMVREDLALQLSPRDLARLLAWHDSAIGKRVIELENARTQGLLPGMAAGTEAGSALPSPARLKLLERLVDATNAAEMIIDIQAELMKAIFNGISTASQQAGKPLSVTPALQELDSRRPEIVAQIRTELLKDSLTAYASLSDPDLQSYVKFQESELGRKFNKASLHALKTSLADAGETFGQLLLNGN